MSKESDFVELLHKEMEELLKLYQHKKQPQTAVGCQELIEPFVYQIEKLKIDNYNKNQKIADLEAKLAESEKDRLMWQEMYKNADRQNKEICETDIYPLQEENQQLKDKLEIKMEELHIAYCGIESVKTKNGNLKEEVKELKQQLAESEKYAEYNIPKLIEANKMMSKQLAEKEKEIEKLKDQYETLDITTGVWIGDLKEEVTELEEEIDKLEKQLATQDKTDFAIEQLEKAVNTIYACVPNLEEIQKLPIALNNYEIGFDKGRFKAVNIIDQQIKELKEKK